VRPPQEAIRPFDIAVYIEGRVSEAAAPSVKQELAASECFDWLVVSQVVQTNPASAVRRPTHAVKTGKTPLLPSVRYWFTASGTSSRNGQRRAHTDHALYPLSHTRASVAVVPSPGLFHAGATLDRATCRCAVAVATDEWHLKHRGEES
jgi:hypothetical protein